MAIITAAEARVYCRVISGTGEDATFNTLISRADAAFASYIGIPAATTGGSASIEDATHTIYLDGPGGQELRLPYLPVQSITSIHDSTDRDYTSTDLVAASDYDLFGDEALVRLKDDSTHGSWSVTKRAIKVVAVIGFASIPEAIKHAAGLQVAHWFQSRDHIGRTNVTQGGGTINIHSLALLHEVKEALQPYRQASCWVG